MIGYDFFAKYVIKSILKLATWKITEKLQFYLYWKPSIKPLWVNLTPSRSLFSVEFINYNDPSLK